MLKSYSFREPVKIQKFTMRTDLKVQVNGKTEWVKRVILQGRRVEKKKSEIGDRSLRFQKDKNR